MASIVYRDFYLIIHPPDGQGRYKAQVSRSGGGDAEGFFTRSEIEGPTPGPQEAPFAPARAAELAAGGELFLVRTAQPPTPEAAKALGGRLFNAVFKEDVHTALRLSMSDARNNRSYLRLRLNLSGVPELAALPWEFLFNQKTNHFYAPSLESPIVRYISLDEPIGPITVEGPLRVLVMVANVIQLDQLNVEEEWGRLNNALAKLVAGGQVEVERLNGNSAAALNDELMRRRDDRPYHVFHFIGHGAYNPARRQSALMVMREDGQQVDPLSAERLGVMLKNHGPSLRLVVLNSCEGARADESDIYAGTAQSIVREAALPAVIAMQYRITDKAAIKFTQRFYGALAAGKPLEAALTDWRADIFAAENTVEWATPALYLRSEGGQLFEPREDVLPPPPPHVSPEMDEHYRKVVDALTEGKVVPFLGLDVNLYGRRQERNWEPGSSLPSSRELAAYLARVYSYPDGEPLDLVSVSQYAAVTKEGTGDLYDKLRDIFNRKYEPTPLHRFFANLPALLRSKGYPRGDDPLRHRFVIAATTYDNLLERAFQEINQAFHVVSYVISGEQSGRFFHSKYVGATTVSQPAPIADPNNYPALSDPDPIILKLPGAVEEYDQRFAIIEDHFSDYLTYKDLSGLLPPQLKAKLKVSSHLFLGSGMRSWHLRGLLYRIWESRRANLASWAVHPEPQPVDREFWRAAGVKVFKVEFEPYVAGLMEMLNGTAQAEKKS